MDPTVLWVQSVPICFLISRRKGRLKQICESFLSLLSLVLLLEFNDISMFLICVCQEVFRHSDNFLK